MKSDIPKKNALTCKDIYDTVGNGSWIRVSSSNWKTNGKWDLTSQAYAYVYQNGDGTCFSSDDSDYDGGKTYWGGDLGYASDAWVDGRYVGNFEVFVQGAKFEDYPTSDIILSDYKVPNVTYDYDYYYDYNTDKYVTTYSNVKVKVSKKTVRFYYDESDKNWKISSSSFDDNCADYNTIATLVEKGLLDQKYFDMVTLYSEDVKALNVDRNTDTIPTTGYIYDGTAKPGTAFTTVYIENNKDIEVKLSSDNFTYTGSTITPTVKVTYKGKKLKKEQAYKVDYSNNVKTGKATITITGIGQYSGKIVKTFNIVPKKATISKLTSPKTKQIKVKWKKDKQASGYQIVYSTNSKFTSNKKIVNVGKKNTTSKTITKLKKGKTYYVKVRSYKTVKGKKIYGSYSKVKKIKCK